MPNYIELLGCLTHIGGGSLKVGGPGAISSLPFPAFSFPSPCSPSLPPLSSLSEVDPLLQLGGLGNHLSSPSGSGRSPAAKRILVHFKHKFALFERLNNEKILILQTCVGEF